MSSILHPEAKGEKCYLLKRKGKQAASSPRFTKIPWRAEHPGGGSKSVSITRRLDCCLCVSVLQWHILLSCNFSLHFTGWVWGGNHTNYRQEFNFLMFPHLSFLPVSPFFPYNSFLRAQDFKPTICPCIPGFAFFSSIFRWTWWKNLIFQFPAVFFFFFFSFIFSPHPVSWFCPVSLLHQIPGQTPRHTAICCLLPSDSWHLVGTVSPFPSTSDTSYSINDALSNRCGRIWRLEYKQLYLNTQTAAKGRRWTQWYEKSMQRIYMSCQTVRSTLSHASP